MKHYEFKTKGVCSQKIEFDSDGVIVENVKFTGGCNGNLKAIGLLVEGQEIAQVIEKLSGITCGGKATSCADQLSLALKEISDKSLRIQPRNRQV